MSTGTIDYNMRFNNGITGLGLLGAQKQTLPRRPSVRVRAATTS